MQDSNPQADGNAEARSRDEWRSDRSADTVLRDGARIPTPADGAGAASALEEGVWGRNLAKVSPQLARGNDAIDARARNYDSAAAGPGTRARVRYRLLAGARAKPHSRSGLGSGGNRGSHEGRA